MGHSLALGMYRRETDNETFWKKLVSYNNDDDDERTCGNSCYQIHVIDGLFHWILKTSAAELAQKEKTYCK